MELRHRWGRGLGWGDERPCSCNVAGGQAKIPADEFFLNEDRPGVSKRSWACQQLRSGEKQAKVSEQLGSR